MSEGNSLRMQFKSFQRESLIEDLSKINEDKKLLSLDGIVDTIKQTDVSIIHLLKTEHVNHNTPFIVEGVVVEGVENYSVDDRVGARVLFYGSICYQDIEGGGNTTEARWNRYLSIHNINKFTTKQNEILRKGIDGGRQTEIDPAIVKNMKSNYISLLKGDKIIRERILGKEIVENVDDDVLNNGWIPKVFNDRLLFSVFIILYEDKDEADMIISFDPDTRKDYNPNMNELCRTLGL